MVMLNIQEIILVGMVLLECVGLGEEHIWYI